MIHIQSINKFYSNKKNQLINYLLTLSSRKHWRSSKVAALESDAAQRGVWLSTRRLSLLFLFLFDSHRFVPKRADSGKNRNWNGHQNCRFRPKQPPKQANTVDSGRNWPKWAAAAIILLHVALWEEKKEKREREGRRRWKDKKKMGGRKIKLCNKRI